MILDTAFFGLARTGTMDGKYQYPILLNSRGGEVKKEDSGMMILGDRLSLSRSFASKFDGISKGYDVTDNFMVLTHGTSLIKRPKSFYRYLVEAHAANSYHRLLYLPGISDPYLIPVLVYLGISVFDDLQLRTESAVGISYGAMGASKGEGDIEKDNRKFVEGILKMLSISMKNLSLRNLVENYQLSSTAIEFLRLADRTMNEPENSVYPSYTGKILAYGNQSLNRPDIRRYRSYISGEYTPPSHLPVLLIIPCSARKPYSTSKSHRRIADAIQPFRKYLHELILTSPIGLVPRELEEMYPPSFYDIPVTGDWNLEEKSLINDMLRSYLSRSKYERIVAFLPKEYEFVSEVLDSADVIFGKYNRDDDLAKLRDRMSAVVSELGTKPQRAGRWDVVSKLRLQFGSWFPDISGSIRVVRNFNLDQVLIDNKVNFVIVPERGKLTITRNAAPFFLESGRNLVEIDDFKPTANIYAVGVTGVSPGIRQEDEVVITHAGDVRGVGIAKMPREAMISLSKGVAVKVRN